MVRGNRRAPRRRRGNRRARRRMARSSTTSAVAVIPRGRSLKIETLRDLSFYVQSISEAGVVSSSWLDNLASFGAIALKLFVYVLSAATKEVLPTSENGLTKKVLARQVLPVSAVQAIWLGAEDLLYRHAIVEFEDRKIGDTIVKYPFIDYRQAIVRRISVRLTCGSPVSSRAGRFTACIINAVEEELADYMPSRKGSPWRTIDTWSFMDVAQMPGAVVAPYGRAVALNWRPSADTYARRALQVGQRDVDGISASMIGGGKPVCRLIFGYQDFASTTSSIAGMYSPNELSPQISIRGTVELREQGRQYIRWSPPATMDTSTVGYSTSASQGVCVGNINSTDIFEENGCLYQLAPDKVLNLEDMALE